MLLPGAAQMQHARALLESRPYFSRIPDQSLIVSEQKGGTYYMTASRDEAGTYALIYFPFYREAEINLSALCSLKLIAHWFNPRTGHADFAGEILNSGVQIFSPPMTGPDWVLVLDSFDASYPTPGAEYYRSIE